MSASNDAHRRESGKQSELRLAAEPYLAIVHVLNCPSVVGSVLQHVKREQHSFEDGYTKRTEGGAHAEMGLG